MAGRGMGQRRRRVLGVLIVVPLLLGLSSWALHGRASDPLTQAYERWRDGPTQGDLAGDGAVIEAALAAWTRHAGLADAQPDLKHLLDHPTSDPRVVWAGTFGSARAAVVVQRADITPKESPGLDEGIPPGSDVWGFLRVGPGGAARISTVTYFIGGDVPYTGVLGGWVDRQRGLGLLLDLGVRLVTSRRVEVRSDGSYGRVTQPIRFTRAGIHVVDVGMATPLRGVQFGPAKPRQTDRYALPGTGWRSSDKELDWSVPSDENTAPVVPITRMRLAGSAGDVTMSFGDTAGGSVGQDLTTTSWGTGPWSVAGRFADGTTAIVSVLDLDGTPRIGLALGDEYTDQGQLDVDAELPVAVRLPGARGWVVAAPRATLRYRMPGGVWRAAGFEAALLPGVDRLQVEVTRRGSRQVVTVA